MKFVFFLSSLRLIVGYLIQFWLLVDKHLFTATIQYLFILFKWTRNVGLDLNVWLLNEMCLMCLVFKTFICLYLSCQVRLLTIFLIMNLTITLGKDRSCNFSFFHDRRHYSVLRLSLLRELIWIRFYLLFWHNGKNFFLITVIVILYIVILNWLQKLRLQYCSFL